MRLHRWRARLFGELPIIVAGVLIALGIDAAVRAAGTRQREADYIAGLRVEFAAHRATLERNLQELRGIAEAGRALIGLARRADATVSADSLDRLIRDANSFMVFTPGSSLVATIIASGDLRIIRDHELRNLLTQWEATLIAQALPERHMVSLSELRDELRDIPIAAVYRLMPPDSGRRVVYERAVKTPAFENHIASRLLVADWNYRTTQGTLTYVRRVEDRLQQLR